MRFVRNVVSRKMNCQTRYDLELKKLQDQQSEINKQNEILNELYDVRDKQQDLVKHIKWQMEHPLISILDSVFDPFFNSIDVIELCISYLFEEWCQEHNLIFLGSKCPKCLVDDIQTRSSWTMLGSCRLEKCGTYWYHILGCDNEDDQNLLNQWTSLINDPYKVYTGCSCADKLSVCLNDYRIWGRLVDPMPDTLKIKPGAKLQFEVYNPDNYWHDADWELKLSLDFTEKMLIEIA